jgi:hypothetical protein
MRKLLILTAWLAMSLLGAAEGASLEGDFSVASNPNGDWSYGYLDGGGFNIYDTTATAITFTAWTSSAGLFDPYGNIGRVTGGPLEAFGSYREDGQIILGPDNPNGSRLTAARWTAPAAGTYKIAATFTGQRIDPGGNNSTVTVLHNGAPLFSGEVNGFVGRAVNGFSDGFGSAPAQSYSGSAVLAMGDTIDFTNDGGAYIGPVGVVGEISLVPEPASLVLFGVGVFTLACRCRRRKIACASATNSGADVTRALN